MALDLEAAKAAAKWMRSEGVSRLHLRGADGEELSLELDANPFAALDAPIPPDEIQNPAPPTGACIEHGCPEKAAGGRYGSRCPLHWRAMVTGASGAA